MQYYKAKIRLDGQTFNEVWKVASAPEILILQYIHGVDCIASIEVVEEKTINLREEKDRLKGLYDLALKKRKQSVDNIFGPLGTVPDRLPADLLERYGVYDEDDVVSVAKAATKTDKNHSQNMSQLEQNRVDHVVPQDEVTLEDLAG